MPDATAPPAANWRQDQGVEMLYQSPADFCAKYAEAHDREIPGGFDQVTTLERVTVVSETPDTARVEAVWWTSGHAPDAGYYEVAERTVFVLVKRHDGWHEHSSENFGYE